MMRHLFGRSKPWQGPANASFTQQQVKVFAVLQAATLAAPCVCHCRKLQAAALGRSRYDC